VLARAGSRARFGRGRFPRRPIARDHATFDFGVPAAVAVQGICGRWCQTIHERILFKGTAAADPMGAANSPCRGSPLNQVCEGGSRIGT